MRRHLMLAPLVALACGGNASPTSPSPPPATQIAGAWSYTARVASVSGGECFASAFQLIVGTTLSGTIQVTQSGSSLTATLTESQSGAACAYQGTAESSSLALNATGCQALDVSGATCPIGGARRDIRLVADSINATVSGGTATGTEMGTYNVIASSTGAGVGTLTINSSFSATRR